MGVSSLVLTAVGYGVGRYREVRDPAHGLMPIPVGAAATLGWVLAFAAVSFMLDVGASVSAARVPRHARHDRCSTPCSPARVRGLPAGPAARRWLVDPLELRRRRRAPARDRPARPARAGGLERVPRRRQPPPTLTPQLALRVAIIGGIALVAFAVVFFRLWYLQVLSGDKYQAEANDNQVREIKVQAPRGEIVDRDGPRAGGQPHRPGREGHARRSCPRTAAERREVYERLGRVLGMTRRADRADVGGRSSRRCPSRRPRSSRTSPQKLVCYLLENQERLPGRRRSSRCSCASTRTGEIGAHLFGTVGEVTKEQLEDTRYRGVDAGRPRRPVGHRVRSTTASCAARTAPAGCRWTRWATCAASCATRSPSRAASCGCRWTSTCSGRASRRSAAPRARSWS